MKAAATVALLAIAASLTGCGPQFSSSASAPASTAPAAQAAAKAPAPPAATVSALAACQALAAWESSSATGSVADDASLRKTFQYTAKPLSSAFATWTSDIKAGSVAVASDADFVSLECTINGVTVFPSDSAPVAAPATTAPAVPVTSAPPAAPAGKTVATFSGSGIERTAKFTVTDTWKLDYSFDCSSFGTSGNFIVNEDGGSDFSGASVNELGTGKSGSTYAYGDAGTHYLEINSECSWSVEVIDEG